MSNTIVGIRNYFGCRPENQASGAVNRSINFRNLPVLTGNII